MSWEIRQGDALGRLREMETESVQTVVTSPPYFGLRDYGTAEWEGGDSGCDHTEEIKSGSYNQGFNERWGNAAGERKQEERGKRPFKEVCGKCGARRIDSQLGLEPTPEQYVANLVAVFREVRRVLRKDGTVWLNLGDSYASDTKGSGGDGTKSGLGLGTDGTVRRSADSPERWVATSHFEPRRVEHGLKPKDLVGIPWRVAFALQADGWWLRSDIIWSKPNPMPESVTDRPTRAHEYLFLLTKSARYFMDMDAIREDSAPSTVARADAGYAHGGGTGTLDSYRGERQFEANGRNRRSVWEIATQPYPEAHFATFPPKLVEPCILAGSPPKCCGDCGAPWERVVEADRPEPGSMRPKDYRTNLGQNLGKTTIGQSNWHDGRTPATRVQTLNWRSTCAHDDDSSRSVVLDPFCGSGTTGVVALRHDRSFIGIELNESYCELARDRIREDAPLLNAPLEVAA